MSALLHSERDICQAKDSCWKIYIFLMLNSIDRDCAHCHSYQSAGAQITQQMAGVGKHLIPLARLAGMSLSRSLENTTQWGSGWCSHSLSTQLKPETNLFHSQWETRPGESMCFTHSPRISWLAAPALSQSLSQMTNLFSCIHANIKLFF